MGLLETKNGQKNVDLFFSLFEDNEVLRKETLRLLDLSEPCSYEIIGGAGMPDAIFTNGEEKKVIELKKISSAINSIRSLSYANQLISGLSGFSLVEPVFEHWLKTREIKEPEKLSEFFWSNFDSIFSLVFDSDLYSFTHFENRTIFLLSKGEMKKLVYNNLKIEPGPKGSTIAFDSNRFLNAKKKGGGAGPRTLVFYLSFNSDIMKEFMRNDAIVKFQFLENDIL
jgi:hypothetical protein